MSVFLKFRKETLFGNWVLFFSVFSVVFLVPLFPVQFHGLIYNLLYSAIFLMAVLAVEKSRGMILKTAIAVLVITWLSVLLDLKYLTAFSRLANLLFFIYLLIRLIFQVAATRRVTLNVILESINGYLLLGIAFSLLVVIINILNPDAFHFPIAGEEPGQISNSLSDYFYFTFVTLTTLGYGDVVPQAPYARSLATLIAVTGQIYIAVIIAMLVGKYISNAHSAE